MAWMILPADGWLVRRKACKAMLRFLRNWRVPDCCDACPSLDPRRGVYRRYWRVDDERCGDAAMRMGAKVTMMTTPPTHIGVCEGNTMDEVRLASQNLVARAMAQGVSTSPIPKPHISGKTRVNA